VAVERIAMSTKKATRGMVLAQVAAGKVSPSQAAHQLGVGYRQARRLFQRFTTRGRLGASGIQRRQLELHHEQTIRRRRRSMSKVSAWLLLLWVAPVVAQGRSGVTRDSAVVASVNIQWAAASAVLPVLRPIGRPASRAQQDRLADSLVEQIIARAPAENGDFTSVALVDVLVDAARRTGPGGPAGVPYPGSASRLIRIHRTGPPTAVVTRGAALSGLSYVIGSEEVLRYVRDVAISHDPTSGLAMVMLIEAASPAPWRDAPEDRRSQAMTFLREIWKEAAPGFVADAARDNPNTQPLKLSDKAAITLYQFGRKQGWVKGG
jgi:hypothetical protein